ncbi:universal stress protein [Spirosoma sp. SC4-14]|uniref:universal stress protein n=1 Tax=Spirosoma sp. SC4-14 TaxID=3128900 RepID=UPI0030CB99ED
MKKVLVLTDFSEASHNALRFTRSLFADTDTDFHLLCVYPIEPDGFYGQKHVKETACTAFTDSLQELAQTMRTQPVLATHTFRSTALPGTLLDAVQSVLDEDAFDLVVLGSKKEGTNVLFGNSATTLVRQLQTNVLIVPSDSVPQPVRHIVLAADVRNQKGCNLLAPVKDMVIQKEAELTLLMIDTPGRKNVHPERETCLRQYLTPVIPTVARIQAPNVRQGIDTYLDGHVVDLLVMIPRHKGWTDILTGSSVTRSLAFAPPVPLLTLYDNGLSDQAHTMSDLSNLDYAL